MENSIFDFFTLTQKAAHHLAEDTSFGLNTTN
jgi:hypothetical protein